MLPSRLEEFAFLHRIFAVGNDSSTLVNGVPQARETMLIWSWTSNQDKKLETTKQWAQDMMSPVCDPGTAITNQA